ncbi:MAG: hypothetical protein CL610_01555 [Anaerolineaceae bacterium]|nr:hypothetical protein [Anaerolineaceae bacterium]
MSDNHDFYWLEKAERLLQDGRPTGEPLLDDLAGTVPQARESFQQELEEQLLSTWHNKAQVETMHVQTITQDHLKKKHLPRGLPVMLAAAIAVLLFGSLSVFFANLPPSENPLLFSAGQVDSTQSPPDGMMWTATAIIAEATYQAASTQMAQVEEQMDAAQRQMTEQAARVQGTLAGAFISPTFVPTSTPFLAPLAGAASCLPESLTVYTQPGTDVPVLAEISGSEMDTYQVEGTLILNEHGGEWFLVVFVQDGESMRGWVPAGVIREACQPLIRSDIPDPLLLTATPIPFADSSISSVCPAQQLLLYAQPAQSAPLVGDMPFDATILIEGSLTLNMGDSWLLVVLQGVRGWLPAQALPPECLDALVPQGVPALDKLSVPTVLPTVPPPSSAVQPLIVTATPVPSATWTPFPTTTNTHTPVPTLTFTPTAYRMITETVQVRVGDAEELDLKALTGQSVDIYIAVGSEDEPVIVAAARGVTVLEFVEVPMPNETRYVYIEAVILPRTTEQLELLTGLAATGMEMKLEPAE